MATQHVWQIGSKDQDNLKIIGTVVGVAWRGIGAIDDQLAQDDDRTTSH